MISARFIGSASPTLPRFFLGPLEICGHYGALTRGLRELGATAHFLDASNERSTYGYMTNQGGHWIISAYLRALSLFRRTRVLRRFDPRRYLVTLLLLAAQLSLILWVSLCHDVIILKSGMGILDSGLDLKLYRSLGRTVVFFYHGSESRAPYINGGYADCSGEWLADRTRWVKDKLRRAAPYATYVVENPLASHLHERPVCMYQIIGSAVDDSKLQGIYQRVASRKSAVTILHAPSLAEIKGTVRVREAIANLKAEGFSIDYVEVTNVPNAVVMENIARSDIVIDELYSDMFGAMLSLEAVMLGRPCIVGGYGFDVLDSVTPLEFVVPTVRVTPENLVAELRRLIQDENLRREIGERSKAFADNYATPRSLAERVVRLATGGAPSTWFFDPRKADYVYGVGAERTKIQDMVRRMLREQGVDALQLRDKRDVEAEFIAFAKLDDLQQSPFVALSK